MSQQAEEVLKNSLSKACADYAIACSAEPDFDLNLTVIITELLAMTMCSFGFEADDELVKTVNALIAEYEKSDLSVH